MAKDNSIKSEDVNFNGSDRGLDTEFLGISGIDDVVSDDDIKVDLLNADDILNQPIIINGFEERTGSLGSYMIIDATVVETTEDIKISCGGFKVLAKLRAVKEKRALPVQCKFIKERVGQNRRLNIVNV